MTNKMEMINATPEEVYQKLREAYRNGESHAKPIDFKKLPKIIISLDNVYMNKKIKASTLYGEMKDHGKKD